MKKNGESSDLIHDLDYEMYPEQHCIMTEKILKENNGLKNISGQY